MLRMLVKFVALMLWPVVTWGQSIAFPPANASGVVNSMPHISCELDADITNPASQFMEFYKVSDLGAETLLGHTTNGVTDTAKHNITGRFKFHIKNAQLSDEGKYRCKLTVNAQSSQFDTYLTVSDPPASAKLFYDWGNGQERSYAKQGSKNNLTCSSERSRPAATFRWYMDITDISYMAKNPVPDMDGNSYGTAYSVLELNLGSSDVGAMFKCLVDVPGGEGFHSLELPFAFSGCPSVLCSIIWLLVSTVLGVWV